jgi:Ca2+-binding RTX toxin-like protein
MIGGTEMDNYSVDDVGDQVIELGGQFGFGDTVSTTLLTYTLGANIENLDLRRGDSSGYGNELDNRIIGSDGNNILNGFAGNNVLEGREGNDKFLVTSDQSRNAIFGGTGDDTLVYKQGLGGGELPWAIDHGQSAFFDGEDGTDNAALDFSLAQSVTATVNGNAVVYDILGADGYHSTVRLISVERVNIIGSAAADTFYGTSGNDWIDAGGGADTVHGSAGDDGYVFDNAGDRVVNEAAGGGTDTIWASVSVNLNDNAFVENLRLSGTAINGIGNGLANMITGNAGSNLIAGGAGNDSLYGKGGADTFHFNEMGAANKDSIWDFDADDKISLGSVFTGLDKDNNGVVDDDAFLVLVKNGPKVSGDHAVLTYNAATGVLSYDHDGAGKDAAQDIAFVGVNKAFFDHSDILINSSLLV